jgi:hypothetical protein
MRSKHAGVTKLKIRSLLIGSAAMMALAACAKVDQGSGDELAGGIIGGQAVAPTDPIAKTIVAIYDKEKQTLCTGSILSKELQLIITAAHCANKEDPQAMVLIFGTSLPTKNGPPPVFRQVVDLRINPRYEQVMTMFEQNQTLAADSVKEWGDIAVLKFVGGLPPGYEAADLLNVKVPLRNGLRVTLAGYGEIDGNRHISSDKLNRADVVLADAGFSPTEVMMDQRNGKGACHGDSGGPAYIAVGGKTYLFGVTSRGVRDPGNNCSTFSVYSNIPAMIGLVAKFAKDLVRAPIPKSKPRPAAPRKARTSQTGRAYL